MKLIKSTVFQLGVLMLAICALVIVTDDSLTPVLTWKDWMDYAQKFLYTYAAKEGVVYGSSAYKERVNVS